MFGLRTSLWQSGAGDTCGAPRILGFGDNRVSGMVYACEATSELGPAINRPVHVSSRTLGHNRMWAKGTAGQEEGENGVATRREARRAEGDVGWWWGCSVGRRVG